MPKKSNEEYLAQERLAYDAGYINGYIAGKAYQYKVDMALYGEAVLGKEEETND